jgi:hypothetical protein
MVTEALPTLFGLYVTLTSQVVPGRSAGVLHGVISKEANSSPETFVTEISIVSVELVLDIVSRCESLAVLAAVVNMDGWVIVNAPTVRGALVSEIAATFDVFNFWIPITSFAFLLVIPYLPVPGGKDWVKAAAEERARTIVNAKEVHTLYALENRLIT